MEIGPILEQYGLAGLIIFVLATVVLVLWKENRILIKQLFDVQEQRRLEALETQKELTQTMHIFSQTSGMLVDKIRVARGEK